MATRKFNPDETSLALEQTQEMDASVKAFMETDFSSYLHLGELDLESLHQLCYDLHPEENLLAGSSHNVRPSSTPPGK